MPSSANRLDDPRRRRRVEQIGSGGPGDPSAETLQRLTRLAGRLLGAPVALVTLVDQDRQVFASQSGLPERLASRGETPLTHSFCKHAVVAGEPFVVSDAREDPLLRDSPAIGELRAVAYAGIPLRVGAECVGALCVIDGLPREWTGDELLILDDLAAAAESALSLRWMIAEREESLARHRALARHIPGAAVVLFDREMRCLLADGPVLREMAGAARPIGKTPADVFLPAFAERLEAACRAALTGETRSLRAYSRSGRDFDITVAPTRSGNTITGTMALGLDVTDRARLEAEQAALLEIARAVAEGESHDALLDLVVQRIIGLFDAVGAAIFRFDRPGSALVLAAASPASELGAGRRVTLDSGTAVGRVLELGIPAVVRDYGDSPDPRVRALRELGAVGGAAAPIRIGRRLWGALGIGGANPDRLNETTAARLARFATLVAANLESIEAHDALTREATTDPLTGLPNRRSFDERLSAEVARARRFAHPLALVLFDIDHFKAVNDEHGHQVGDEVLVALAEVVAREVREGELVARIGGEEFALILPETDEEGALIAAERSRGAVSRTRFEGPGRVTISLGVAALGPGERPSDLVRRADEALYRAKADGRNLTRLAPGD